MSKRDQLLENIYINILFDISVLLIPSKLCVITFLTDICVISTVRNYLR